MITGASQGLGRELALQLASRGENTLLAALPGENLQAVCDGCRSFGVRSECFELDLTDRDSLMDFISEVDGNYQLSMLINNAGTGGSRRFTEVPLKYIDTIMKLNVLATTVLTHELLPNLRRNAPARILNISSLAAMIPTGYKTVYPASKAYIKHFSLGMREELRPYGISVSLALLHQAGNHRQDKQAGRNRTHALRDSRKGGARMPGRSLQGQAHNRPRRAEQVVVQSAQTGPGTAQVFPDEPLRGEKRNRLTWKGTGPCS